MLFEDLLPYYERELSELRSSANEFSEAYPGIASRLLINGDSCDDPHVERLLEGFAFLTARVQKKIADDFPEITESLLGLVYPYFTRPIPSTAIIQFSLEQGAQLLTTKYAIAKDSQILSPPIGGTQCNFRTCYETEIWPVELVSASFLGVERSSIAGSKEDTVGIVQLKLACKGEVTFSELKIDRLKFFLDGSSSVVNSLYELLCNNVNGVSLLGDCLGRQVSIPLSAGCVNSIGFAEHENVLPKLNRVFEGYRLLLEYFSCPSKFLFFEISDLQKLQQISSKEVTIAIAIKQFARPERMDTLVQNVSERNFKLWCTPVINLFDHPAEPIRLTGQAVEYRVVPNLRKQKSFEVFDVLAVKRIRKVGRSEVVSAINPIFSLLHGYEESDSGMFWHMRRYPSRAVDDAGSEVSLSLIDLAFEPMRLKDETLSMTLLCTNRDVPSKLPYGGGTVDLDAVGGGAVSKARFLTRPSDPIRVKLGGGALWRLVSHLSLNYLSIVEGGTNALQEILSLYNFQDSSAVRKQISGVKQLTSRPIVRRMSKGGLSAFVHGTEITLTIDESSFIGGTAFLFVSVLDKFFGLYCGVNSFTQLIVKSEQREEVMVSCLPRAGQKIII